MEEFIVHFFQKIDIQNLISLGIIVFSGAVYLKKQIRKDLQLELDPMKKDLSLLHQQVTTLQLDLKSLKENIHDVDRRLCRIEGALSSKDCCVLKTDQNIRKAE